MEGGAATTASLATSAGYPIAAGAVPARSFAPVLDKVGGAIGARALLAELVVEEESKAVTGACFLALEATGLMPMTVTSPTAQAHGIKAPSSGFHGARTRAKGPWPTL